jgi:hypothetical protein
MTTYYNDVFGDEPHSGELKAVSRPAPHHEEVSSLDGADGTDGTDGTDTNAQRSRLDRERPVSQATQIVNLVLDSGAELFYDLNDQAYVTIPVNGHRQTLPVERMGKLAGKLYYSACGRAPASQAVHEALGVLSGKALYEGTAHPVWTRLADHAGRLYLDLGDDTWQVVEIDAVGWRVMGSNAVPVRFRRSPGMQPLPVPVAGGSLRDLDPFLNLRTADDRLLLTGWLVGTFCLHGGRAILELNGEQGSSKSTTANMLRRLVDPCRVPLRAAPRTEQDLVIAATNGLIVAYDNLSEIRPWLSDALCRLSTGGGIGGRKLYTDFEEATLEAQRPVLITSITGVATRGDLLDRTLSITLPAISNHQRRTESTLWAEFDLAVPGILGALLDAVSMALRNRKQTRLGRTPRLADFVTWVEAAAPALGWQRGQFLTAFETSRQDQDEVALESEAIGPPILALMTGRQVWSGTATELLAALNTLVPEELRQDRAWPRNPSKLGKQLERLGPNLRRLGIVVERTRGGRAGTRRITLTRATSDDSCQTRQSRQGNRDEWLADRTEGPDVAGWETRVA